MSTKPAHDTASIAADAERVLSAALEDVHDKAFAKRLARHELYAFKGDIASLKLGDGARTTKLENQVAAGVHAAKTRAPVVEFIRDVRDDAALELASDQALQYAFGGGLVINAGSTSSVEHAAHTVLAAVHDHPREAQRLHLDARGVQHLQDLIRALESADVAHVQTANARHTHTTATDSLSHVVSSEAAHIRRIAARIFSHDEGRLARYNSMLPRHKVEHRSKHSIPPPGGTTG
jgi:hypothetical protein